MRGRADLIDTEEGWRRLEPLVGRPFSSFLSPDEFMLVNKGLLVRFQAAWIGPRDLAGVQETIETGSYEGEWPEVSTAKPPTPKQETARNASRPGILRRLIQAM